MKQKIYESINRKLIWKAQKSKISDDYEAIFQATRTVVINAGVYTALYSTS